MSHPTESRTRLGVVRRYPFDLVLVSILTVASYLLVTTLPAGDGLRLLGALPLVVFLPGYALVSMLFPAAARSVGERTTGRTADDRSEYRGVDWIERVSLSFATSLMIVPLVAMGLSATQSGLTTRTVAVALGGLTLVIAQFGAIRRLRVPEVDRFRLSPRKTIARTRRSADDGVIAAASTVLLAACVVTAAGAIGFAIVSPQSAGSFSELGVFTEDEDGDLVANEYPADVAPNESAALIATIENQQGERESYELVVQQQRLEDDEVVDRTRLDRFETAIEDGETERIEHGLEPDAQGETVRIVYLLYEDVAPENPTIENAEEDVFVWLSVTEPDAGVEPSEE